MTKPWALEEAELVDSLAQRYHLPPSVVLAEDVSILRRLAIVRAGQCEACGHPKGPGHSCKGSD